ncbi:MAG TPA: hypothetical protein VG673_05885 [Actinomycetota bacterium]|nr:hypothetical protein [Actinomycetota bacterium]
MAPDRTAFAAGVTGLALAASAALVRPLVTGPVPEDAAGTPVPFTLDRVALAAVSMVGFFLGVLAIWSAIKSWLRDDLLSLRARWGAALGAAAMLVVVAVGPCGPPGCPG